MLALAGLIAITSWIRSDDGQDGASAPQQQAETGNGPIEPIIPATWSEPVVLEDATLPDPVPAQESMRDYLLGTPAANRNRILGLAITENGYDCSSVRSAALVGNSGSHWRAHCGAADIYWIVVGEYSQFSVAPMPYGDLDLPSVPRQEFPQIQPQRGEPQFFEPPETPETR